MIVAHDELHGLDNLAQLSGIVTPAGEFTLELIQLFFRSSDSVAIGRKRESHIFYAVEISANMLEQTSTIEAVPVAISIATTICIPVPVTLKSPTFGALAEFP